jgi:hypothetical protein
MINRRTAYRLEAKNPDPRPHAEAISASTMSPGDDQGLENGAKMALAGYATIDRANPENFNLNRRGIAPPALDAGPRLDWDDATITSVLY